MAELMKFRGTVEWSGENPLMSLKNTFDGPYVTLASFFRVVLSPHGRGHALILIQSPNEAEPSVELANFCLYDNEALAHFLIDGFLSQFAAYKTLPAMSNLTFHKIDEVISSGDTATEYTETVRSNGREIKLTWANLGMPFCVAFPPEKSATGKHHMPTVIVGSRDAYVSIDGRRLPGVPVPRDLGGQSITSAFLAFSETWVRAET